MEKVGDQTVVRGLELTLLVEGDGVAEYLVHTGRYMAFVDVPYAGAAPTDAEKEAALSAWRGYTCICHYRERSLFPEDARREKRQRRKQQG